MKLSGFTPNDAEGLHKHTVRDYMIYLKKLGGKVIN